MCLATTGGASRRKGPDSWPGEGHRPREARVNGRGTVQRDTPNESQAGGWRVRESREGSVYKPRQPPATSKTRREAVVSGSLRVKLTHSGSRRMGRRRESERRVGGAGGRAECRRGNWRMKEGGGRSKKERTELIALMAELPE
ncbi:hypothetical protein FB451DRAFT_1168973 [Mycena latifolia]|nr:hypothetical protein FB451DRAFT_1168973 [Mycena latifolia]